MAVRVEVAHGGAGVGPVLGIIHLRGGMDRHDVMLAACASLSDILERHPLAADSDHLTKRIHFWAHKALEVILIEDRDERLRQAEDKLIELFHDVICDPLFPDAVLTDPRRIGSWTIDAWVLADWQETLAFGDSLFERTALREARMHSLAREIIDWGEGIRREDPTVIEGAATFKAEWLGCPPATRVSLYPTFVNGAKKTQALWDNARRLETLVQESARAAEEIERASLEEAIRMQAFFDRMQEEMVGRLEEIERLSAARIAELEGRLNDTNERLARAEARADAMEAEKEELKRVAANLRVELARAKEEARRAREAAERAYRKSKKHSCVIM